MLVSIVIDNFNYARFIREAIDSALNQTYPDTEVIVVDDGSTDQSRSIIQGYGERIRSVFKENGGQASAFNAGFAEARGDVVIFLDSDDTLHPDAVSNAVGVFQQWKGDRPLAKVQWRLSVVDAGGRSLDETRPPLPPPEGDFRTLVLERGPTNVVSSPTSGNAWARSFLEWAMPAPEDVPYYRLCADEYLYTLAAVFGAVRTIHEPQGRYRIHGANVYSARTSDDKMRLELEGHEQQCQALSRFLKNRGIGVDVEQWRRHSWFHRICETTREIIAIIPRDEVFVFIDDGTWGKTDAFAGNARPLRCRDGVDWGPPDNDEEAIEELRKAHEAGANYLVVVWPSFWWLGHFQGFAAHLRSRFHAVLENERVVIFDLRPDRPQSE